MTRLEMSRQFADNLEKERIRLRFSQKQMAEKLEISLSAYKRLITYNTERIDLYVLYKLYLLTGKLAYEFTGVTDSYLETKRKVMGLTPMQLAYIEAIVDFENAFKDSHCDYEDYLTVYVPTGNMEDGMIYDSANIEKVKLPDFQKKYGSMISCGVQITSNHLHPVYNKGDILLIAKKPIRDGDTGIFFNKESGRAYIRKFYQTNPCMLEPVNGYGQTLYVDSNSKNDMEKWIKFGIVVTKLRL